MANPYNDDGITLKIKVTPRTIERVIFVLIILVLAFFVVFDTFCDKSCTKENSTLTGAAVQEVNEKDSADSVKAAVEEVDEETGGAAEEIAEEINETAETNDTAEINDTAEANETAAVNETEEEQSYSGNIELTINDVMTELKNEGAYGKVTGVRFTLTNEKEDFMPQASVYTYEDGDTSSVFATTPRVERLYSTLSLGQTNSYELDVSSQQFPDLSEYIICKVVIKDKATGDTVVTQTEKFKITS